jgi:uncharacterized membrane protein YccC
VEAVLPRKTLARLAVAADPGAAALGLQMALAGVTAFFFAQLLRLEFPSWSVFTVIMLLLAQYVGAIQEKAVFRMVGTLAGGILGYLATGAWQQSPVLYLGTAFVVVSLSVAMFSQSRAPYAFLLTGLTFVVISSNSQDHPQVSWAYALARVEEVLVGIVVSLVVQSTVFPRYANRDFQRLLEGTLGELAAASEPAAARFAAPHTGLDAAMRDFPSRAASLRTLLRFGARESKRFRHSLGRHSATITHLSRAANILRSLESVEPAPEPYRGALAPAVMATGARLREGWLMLRDRGALDEAWRRDVARSVEDLQQRVRELRRDPLALALAPAEVGATSLHLLALDELRETLNEIDQLWRNPPAAIPRGESLALAPAWPDGFWIRHGIRAGLATTFALFVENWLSPPGGPLMVLGSMMFTALNALSPEGSGDRGAFGWVVFFTGVLVAAFLLLLAGTPLMASYAVLNTVLAVWLFLLGYWLHDRGGVTVPLQFSFLLVIAILGLNAQHPVGVQQVAGVFFGLANALLISSVAQRLLWPVLPQRQLTSALAGHLRTVAACLPDALDNLPVWQRMRMGLFPTQARHLIGAMRGPSFPRDEMAALDAYVITLRRLVGELFLCAGKLLPALPPELRPLAEPATARAKAVVGTGLQELALAFEEQRPPRDLRPEIDRVISEWNACSEELRRAVHRADLAPGVGVRILGLCGRYRAALALLREAVGQARALRLSDYMGDVSL